MLGIAQDKLKCVFAWRQFDTCLCLSGPEMKVVLVLWNCIIRIEWLIHIYQQMVMTGVWKIVPRMGYAHIAQTKAAPKSSFNNRAILRPRSKDRHHQGQIFLVKMQQWATEMMPPL